jgi:hypothetical protein
VVVGEPKLDDELDADFDRQGLGGHYLSDLGERTARDCWIKIYRGIEDEDDIDDQEGHIVFLGQGAQEATRAENTNNGGAIATPHGRWFKGWRRVRTWSGENLGVLQFEDLERTDGLIALAVNTPAANNPYCDALPGQAYKDGVQAHPGNQLWTSNGMSVGCTTVSRVAGGTPQNPSSTVGQVSSVNSSFGNDADGLTNFTNKQTRRGNQTTDALVADDHGAPRLNEPAGLGEPVHMQPTFQQAIFGGLLTHEIPNGQNLADDPENRARIRLILRPYQAGSRYYAYHHAVVFGHGRVQQQDCSYRLTVWIPRKVIRGWNGNWRNLLVSGRCQIAWYIEHRPAEGDPIVTAGFVPNNASPQNYGVLAAVGRLERTWTPAAQLAAGQYVSIFRYRIDLRPQGNAHVWTTEAGMNDSFSEDGATLAAETISTINNVRYLEGSSELLVVSVP